MGSRGAVVSRWVAGLAAVLIVLAAVVVIVAADGSNPDSGNGRLERVDLMLDFFPNADHAGIYAAQASGAFARQGLDVRIHAPSDPSVPLKLLAAGRTDLAISYEPEILRARDKGLDVTAVAALVRTPLTAIVSLPRAGIRSPADLRGKVVGTAGIDYQAAYLMAIAPGARARNVGFDLVPALLSGKVDAVLGAYWNYEAIQLRQKRRDPRVIRMETAGVPTYDELVVAAGPHTPRDATRRFLAALAEGTRSLERAPAGAVDALLHANRDLDPKLQRASVAATLTYFLPPPGKPFGWMDPAAWTRFTAFMHRDRLLRISVPSGAMTNALLP
jgi:putative hydroxymethylpyrimidine transport system substrate-binding protein